MLLVEGLLLTLLWRFSSQATVDSCLKEACESYKQNKVANPLTDALKQLNYNMETCSYEKLFLDQTPDSLTCDGDGNTAGLNVSCGNGESTLLYQVSNDSTKLCIDIMEDLGKRLMRFIEICTELGMSGSTGRSKR